MLSTYSCYRTALSCSHRRERNNVYRHRIQRCNREHELNASRTKNAKFKLRQILFRNVVIWIFWHSSFYKLIISKWTLRMAHCNTRFTTEWYFSTHPQKVNVLVQHSSPQYYLVIKECPLYGRMPNTINAKRLLLYVCVCV